MWRLTVFALVATVQAQIPSLGWCPDYLPMADFNMKRFLGTWFEAERYFTISEVTSRCVKTTYESTPEGRILVSNEITNSLTGMKRVMDGHVNVIGREGEGRLIVKYAALPIPYDTEYSILETDYDNYAVLWSCSSMGPVHTQSAWVMTRERLAPMAVMQAAYGVLDRYKISRTFFVKTNQADCNILPDPATRDPQELYKTANVDFLQKKAFVAPVVVDKVVEPVEKLDPVVKPEVPLERSAVPLPEEPSKPMQVPELIMESAEKKQEKIEKPEMKDSMKEMMPIKEKEDMMMKDKPMKDKMPMKEEMKDKPIKEMMPMKEKMPEKEKIPEEKMPEKEKTPEMPMTEESKEKEMKDKPQ